MWVEELPNGKYRACERYTDILTGKMKKVSVTIEKDTRQARKEAQRVLEDKIKQANAESYAPEEITLETLVNAYRNDQKLTVKKSTYQRNYFAMEAIMKMLGRDILVSKITAPYVRQRFLLSGKKASTLNEHLVRFHALMAWAYRNDMIADDRFLDKLERFKATPHKVVIAEKYMESGELKKLLDHMTKPTWKYLTEFLALSGLRVGEAIALENSDVDLEAKQIHVTKAYDSANKVVSSAKSLCSIRDVYIQPELLITIKKLRTEMNKNVLKNGLETRPTLFLFDKDGEHLHYFAYNKYLRENTAAVIGRSLTPHSLRHTHASLLLEAGIPIDVISRRLGHENSKVTKEIYLHVTKRLKEKDDALINKTKLI